MFFRKSFLWKFNKIFNLQNSSYHKQSYCDLCPAGKYLKLDHHLVYHVFKKHIQIVVLEAIWNVQQEIIQIVAHLLEIIDQLGNFLQEKMKKCSDCPERTLQNKADKCTSCNNGTYSSSGYSIYKYCSPEEFSFSRTSKCEKCPAGTLSIIGVSVKVHFVNQVLIHIKFLILIALYAQKEYIRQERYQNVFHAYQELMPQILDLSLLLYALQVIIYFMKDIFIVLVVLEEKRLYFLFWMPYRNLFITKIKFMYKMPWWYLFKNKIFFM